jgi:hypothetical protein
MGLESSSHYPHRSFLPLSYRSAVPLTDSHFGVRFLRHGVAHDSLLQMFCHVANHDETSAIAVYQTDPDVLLFDPPL